MKISVLTPSLNSGQYIQRAIESVLIQDYQNFEHIIVDGHSSDETSAIVQSYEHIKYISEKDKGQSDAMNKAYEMSSGEIIVYLNADDEFLPDAFKTAAKAFADNQTADMVIGDLIFKTNNESRLVKPSPNYIDVLQYWKNLFPNNPVSYFYRRKVQEKIGKFPVDDHFSMDIWFLLKAYKNFKVVKINSVLGIFHSDGKNKTAVADLGNNLHRAVKNHLKKENPFLLPFFYFKLFSLRWK